MKRALLIITALCMLISFTSCNDNSDKSLDDVLSKKKITVGVDYSQYPMVINTNGDKLKGFTAEYTGQIAERLGVSPVFVDIPADKMAVAFENGEIDCYMNLSNPPQNQKTDFYLIKTKIRHKQSVILNPNSDIKSLADLSEKRIGTTLNSYAHSSLDSAEVLSKSVDGIEYFKDTEKLVNALKDNRIDAAIADNAEVLYINKTKNQSFVILDTAIATDDYYICFSRSNNALKDKISSVIESMHNDKTIKKLSEKWFGTDLSDE